VTQASLEATDLAALGDELADRLPEIPPHPPWYSSS
jgi:hypothetical protein